MKAFTWHGIPMQHDWSGNGLMCIASKMLRDLLESLLVLDARYSEEKKGT